MERAITLALNTITKMIDSFFSCLPNLIIGFLVFSFFLFISKFAKPIVVKLTSRANIDTTLCMALGSLAAFSVTFFGMLIAAVIVVPNFSPANLIAGLGITSVAIGFAFQDILRNFFAGLLLLWQKPFGVGDEIRTGEYTGTVQEIDIRSTELKTAAGEIVVVPNGDIYTKPIVVFTTNGKRRAHISVKLDKDANLDKLREAIQTILQHNNKVESDPPASIMLGNIEPGNVALDVYFWTAPHQSSMMQVIDEVSTAIRQRLRSTGDMVSVTDTAQAQPEMASKNAA